MLSIFTRIKSRFSLVRVVNSIAQLPCHQTFEIRLPLKTLMVSLAAPTMPGKIASYKRCPLTTIHRSSRTFSISICLGGILSLTKSMEIIGKIFWICERGQSHRWSLCWDVFQEGLRMDSMSESRAAVASAYSMPSFVRRQSTSSAVLAHSCSTK